MAVKQLYPSAQVTIGPVIEDGFFYDFAFERPFTPDDLAVRSKPGCRNWPPPTCRSAGANCRATRPVAYFEQLGESYKCELIRAIPEGDALSLYRQGDFEDLCRGPHVPSTGKLKAFKLTKVAGAYWRGDAKNAMLQRIYGTCWPDAKASRPT
jgi:threonyl-tRNA synthetase